MALAHILPSISSLQSIELASTMSNMDPVALQRLNTFMKTGQTFTIHLENWSIEQAAVSTQRHFSEKYIFTCLSLAGLALKHVV